MKENKTAHLHTLLWLLFLGSLGAFIILALPQPAQAQCGSSASSCRNCHEVQGEMPVNTDGANWHEAHAFGDFCEFCHAGNVQATDKDTAHMGMEAPLANIQVSCGNCHAADLNERAEVYAIALGVEIGATGSGSEPPAAGSSDETEANTEVASSSSSSGSGSSSGSPIGLIVDDPNVIDYVARYNETVLGIKTVNWGNRILLGLIAVTLVGGGGFVVWNERRLRRPSIPVSPDVRAEQSPTYPGYPPQVVALLPRLAALPPDALQALYQFLEDPAKAQLLLHDLSRLQPDLIQKVRELDREAQALLLALANN